MESLLPTLASGKLSTYGTIILMFTYTILLDRDFSCTCKPQGDNCYLYLILPSFIIFLLTLWTDKTFQRIYKYLCSRVFEQLRTGSHSVHGCSFFWSFFHHILKAALVGLLWVDFVYLDGDLYVCCWNDHSEQQAHLACNASAKNTDKGRVIIAELKNKSRFIGGWLLFGIIFMGSFPPLDAWRKCCKTCCCNSHFIYHKLILEEEEIVLKEIMRQSVKEKLTREVKERICNQQWEECFYVADELITASTEMDISELEKQQQPGAHETQDQKTLQDYGLWRQEELTQEEPREEEPREELAPLLAEENPDSSDMRL